MKKVSFNRGLVLVIIVLFLGMNIISSNAVSIQKETLLDEETSTEYSLNIVVFIDDIVPNPPIIFPCKVLVTHEDNPSFRIVKYRINPFISILVPEIYMYPDVNVYSLGYKQIRIYWESYSHLYIYIKWEGIKMILNNPLINHFLILNHLQQIEVR